MKKPATKAQKDARERNWNKGQILCLKAQANRIYSSKTTKASEKIILKTIMNDLNIIIKYWKNKED